MKNNEKQTVKNTDNENCEYNAALQEKKDSARRSFPFFTALAVLTVIAWLLPLRPTQSEEEKRNLAEFPEFNIKTLLNGEYFSEIDSWFSDTFTFRDKWMEISRGLKSRYGLQTVAIVGEVEKGDEVPVVNTDRQEVPIAEHAATPVAEPAPEETPEPMEEESWGGVVLEEEDFVSKGAVLQIGNSAFKITSFSKYYADKYAGYLNKLVEAVSDDVNVYCVLVPENTTYMLSREDRESFGCTPEEDVLDYIYSMMDERIHTVNIIKNEQRHNGEYIAFHTDHHWTALGAYYAYEVWCEAACVEPVPLSEYREIEWEGFLGTYYYKVNSRGKLAVDTVHAYEPPGNVHMYLNFDCGDSLGVEQPLIIDRSTSTAGGKYLTFLGSDSAKVTFVNEDIEDESACVAIKTSFGNPYVYYLTQHYHYVYVIDARYYRTHTLPDFVEKFNIDDVIFVHGTGLAQASGGMQVVCHLVTGRWP